MGKGDKKSKKGKIFKKSYGNCRPRKVYKTKELLYRKNAKYRKKFSKKPSFKQTDKFSIISELSLALVAQKGDNFYSSGTAVLIAPYLAITAKHVLEDFFDMYDGLSIKNRTGEFNGTFSLNAFQTLGNLKDGAVWSITRLWPCHGTDLCLLRLTPFTESAKNYKWRCVKMNFSLPKIGDRIVAFGYSNSKVDTKNSILISYDNSTSVGEVVEVHGQMRDASRLNFPCFMVNARFDGGMSGGPVFDESGQLCGLICSNLPPSTIDEPHASYVTLLWPCLGTQIDIAYEELGKIDKYPLIKLAEQNIIHGENYGNISISAGKIIFKN